MASDFWSLPVRPVLDIVVDAVHALRHQGDAGIVGVFALMNERERVAFDLWLARLGDPLAAESGSTWARFRARVLSMATNEPAVQIMRRLSDEP